MPTPAVTPPDLRGFRLAQRAARADLRRLAALAGDIDRRTVSCDRRRAIALARYVRQVAGGIRRHHLAQDRHVWPLLDRRAAAEVDLAELTDDHTALYSLLDTVSATADAFAAAHTTPAAAQRLAYALADLRDLVDEHVVEEQRTVLPLVQRYLSAADWSDAVASHRWSDLPFTERFATASERAALAASAGPVARVALAVLRALHRRRERIIFR
ncbi:MAG: hemerythrin domain-containing protein [Hamadaea sp.]|nr:hemerythrin domain-containing protein [Hamadaea sp.]